MFTIGPLFDAPTVAQWVLTAQAQGAGIRGRVEVFQQIFEVFLALGTLVGIVVISYMLYNAYKYRDGEDREFDEDYDPPALGEIQTGGGKGKKLFLSFGLSAFIVVGLILWTYTSILYVEAGPTDAQQEAVEIDVEAYQFGWQFIYPNGHTSTTLRVPTDRTVRLTITSRDVFHNFGIPELRVKADAIPGQTTDTWFYAEETGEYTVRCYELCGAGHSYMTADVKVMSQEEYQEWYQNTSGS